MIKIDKQIITMYKIEDGTSKRQYSIVSGACRGIELSIKLLWNIAILEMI